MLDILGDYNLYKIHKSIDMYTKQDDINIIMRKIISDHFLYDPYFLWIVSYCHDNNIDVIKYIESRYSKFKKILDVNFLKKLASKSNFESHMWEMILCDTLSSSGNFKIKSSDSGPDFILYTTSGEEIQIEAVAPDESDNHSLRSLKPDFSKNNMFSISGIIEDIERSVILRCSSSFDYKSKHKKTYDYSKPLIIAINTSRVVGIHSNDDYVIRRVFFGLGAFTLLFGADGFLSKGIEQKNVVMKTSGEFELGRFRDENFSHITGVIYTSQRSTSLIPEGNGWHNSGITYVPNPFAKNRIMTTFPYFKSIISNEDFYQENEADKKFK